jgi:hypothetical protein
MTYKTADYRGLQSNRLYEITLKNTKVLEGKYLRQGADSYVFQINGNQVVIPEDQISLLRRKKISLVKLGVGSALATAGVILLLDNADKRTFDEAINDIRN